jgi:hypothetical protein
VTEPTREQIDRSFINEHIVRSCASYFWPSEDEIAEAKAAAMVAYKEKDQLEIAALKVEREVARERSQVLEERIRKVREIRDNIKCSNCGHLVKLHDAVTGCADAVPVHVSPGRCGCLWTAGADDIVGQLDAVLDGEGEEKQ